MAAADFIIHRMKGAIAARTVTYDFHRSMEAEGVGGVALLKWSEFWEAVVMQMSEQGGIYRDDQG